MLLKPNKPWPGRIESRGNVLLRQDPVADPLPILFDLPQSGTVYPNDFSSSAPMADLHFLISPYVGELLADVATHGCTVLHALFPMTYINANRSPADIDETMLDAPWPTGAEPSSKVAIGIGLIQKMARPGVPIYDRKLSVAEVQHRIDTCYKPYHAEIARILSGYRTRFGGAWHINAHCMGSRGSSMSPDPGNKRADFCIGDRDGTTSDAAFRNYVAVLLREMGYSVSINDPFKGVEIVRRHGRPADGVHSLQVEICRGLFLNEKTNEPTGDFATLSMDMGRLAEGVSVFVRDQIPLRV